MTPRMITDIKLLALISLFFGGHICAQTGGAPDALQVLSQQGPNLSAWALAPIEQSIPDAIRQNITFLREDIVDEGKTKPQASLEAYRAAYHYSSTIIAVLDEREKMLLNAGYRAVQAKVVTPATNQALEARRNYMMSWPQYEREVQQRSDLLRVNEAADKRKVELALQDMKLDWAKRVETMRSSLDAFYVKLRAALRDSGFTIKTFDGAGGGTSSVPAIPAIPAPTTTQTVPAVPQGMLKNSLGMRFVSLPGTNVLICIHETRYMDFSAYAVKNPDIGTSWSKGNDHFAPHPVVAGKERIFGQRRIPGNPDDPVVDVTWEQAKKFCEWLSQKESKTYRLPTDAEWSIAVGIDKTEKWNKNTTPSNVLKNATLFPWGAEWPPPPSSGNFLDYSRKRLNPKTMAVLDYEDGFPYAAPVMSFKPNNLGIYDLEGNVGEWVEDWWDSKKKEHVSRGGTYYSNARETLLASYRLRHPSGSSGCGFRVVVETDP